MDGGTDLGRNLHSAMKAVANAVKLDQDHKNQEAYIYYLQCIMYIAQNLLGEIKAPTPQMDLVRKKFIQLGQKCMERLGTLTDEVGNVSAGIGHQALSQVHQGQPYIGGTGSLQVPQPQGQSPQPQGHKPPGQIPQGPYLQVQPQGQVQGHLSQGQQPLGTTSASTAAQQVLTPSKERMLTPLEQAYLENQQLMSAYKARMAKMKVDNKRAALMSMNLQRRLAENLALAKAREAALERKIRERQQRHQDIAARRFAGEEEKQAFFTQVLNYEEQNKWTLPWREKLKEFPQDASLIHSLVRQILSVSDHPITALLIKYQGQAKLKLEPLVSKHGQDLEIVTVPYPLDAEEDDEEEEDNKTSEYGSLSASNTSKGSTDAEKTSINEGTSLNQSESSCDKALGEVSGTCSNQAESSCDKDLEEVTSDVKDDLESAILKGNRLSFKLKGHVLDSKGVSKVVHKCEVAAKENLDPSMEEKYDVNDMDDLFDDSDNDEGKEEVPSSAETTTQQDQSRPEVDCPESLTTALERHLGIITKDVHMHLDQLMSVFIVAYEELDSPAGRDQCRASMEEPFFKPLWPLLLSLFRIVHRRKEVRVAKVMTRYLKVSPGQLGVAPRLQLGEEDIPYGSAIQELRSLFQYVCPLNKLESLVKVSKLICQCVEESYAKKSDQTSPVPNLGADDLLPILSYIVLRAGVPQIVSEGYAMEEFIHESYLMGEEGYCLTSLQTALGYIASLSMVPLE